MLYIERQTTMFQRLIVVCFFLVLNRASAACPPCPPLPKPCQSLVVLKSTDDPRCFCQTCSSRCYDRYNQCPAGQQCVVEQMSCPGFNCVGIMSATCVPWSGSCVPISCRCPISGFLKDPNNCNTCTCNDPCAELACPNGCRQQPMITPESELRYTCK
ncbi:hypothetical protein HELRODRAFT_192451 [Helobdella robusta]|uniref:Antistasin-like domain-containing protein n=1 Tax=Helobdella robusta TaxID=6412 RepID=T1FTZ2_HELRO|nr:hypothetical protein HELRODRAFT_192451 [Helobdella robusta]ESO00857.1 hypothetical protein HELRODRAFT_192451 [Helobdella robusta]